MRRPAIDRFRRLPALLALAGTLVASGCQAPTERVRLARFDFGDSAERAPYGIGVTETVGLHYVGDGWHPLEPGAVWTTGEPAEVRLTGLGSEARLELHWSTHPELAARGQRVSVVWNGQLLESTTLPGGWQVDTLAVEIPEPLFGAGTHDLRIETSDHLDGADGSAIPRGVFVRRIELSARLDADERALWKEWTATPDTDTDFVGLPVDPDTAHLPRVATPGPDQPDVLFVVLDTVRADHLSSYGYPRPTTPAIDSLATAGVRFERVFAEAPYTRSSMATVFTGASWRDHGVIRRTHALADGFTTLAEVLREAGYRTLAVSDNAHVARSAGSAQGFDEFVQTWSDVDREPPAGPHDWWWPELPVILFEERVREGLDGSAPTFFFVHLMPPHEPYFPGSEHDVFGDPDYDGPVIGHTPDVRAFDRGDYASEGSDHARLVALYDGALRRGDALVARVLRAWEGRGTGRPTLVVFGSDHGEAFGEHGRYGHNTTPYDEMVHVPMVFAPRALVPPSIVESADAFRSLGDLLPLLIGTLGVDLPAGSRWPRRVLEVLQDPARPRDRVFVRCSTPFYGVRTPETLLVFRHWSTQEFYDLRRDPAALEDRRMQRTEPWLAGMRGLRAFLAGSTTGAGVATELDPADVERLRALGY